MKRNRSVVICAPKTGDRLWLTKEDEDTYLDERAPPVVSFDNVEEAEASFGFLHANYKYTLVVYVPCGSGESATPEVISKCAGELENELEVLDYKFIEHLATMVRYLRIELSYHSAADGVKILPVHVSYGAGSKTLSVHANVLKDNQGHPALAPGVRCTMRLHNCDTDVDSRWSGFHNDSHDEGSDSGS